MYILKKIRPHMEPLRTPASKGTSAKIFHHQQHQKPYTEKKITDREKRSKTPNGVKPVHDRGKRSKTPNGVKSVEK